LTSVELKKSPHFKRALNITLSFILTMMFLYIAFRDVDFKDVLERTSQASIFWIIILMIVMMASHFVQTIR